MPKNVLGLAYWKKRRERAKHAELHRQMLNTTMAYAVRCVDLAEDHERVRREIEEGGSVLIAMWRFHRDKPSGLTIGIEAPDGRVEQVFSITEVIDVDPAAANA